MKSILTRNDHRQNRIHYTLKNANIKNLYQIGRDVIGTLLSGAFGWSGSIDFNKQKYIESLRRFARVEMDLMLPGHDMIYFHNPQIRVEEVLNTALMEWR